MNLADYLILAVIAQVFWLTRKVTRLNTLMSGLRSKCPFLTPKEDQRGDE